MAKDTKAWKIGSDNEEENEELMVPDSCRPSATSITPELVVTPPQFKSKHPILDETYKPKSLKALSPGGEVHLHTARSFSKQISEMTPTETEGTPIKIQQEKETRVMVLYTGGTIGMKIHDGVYSPEPDYLPRVIRDLPNLNDQVYVDAHYGQKQIQPYCLPPVRHCKRRILYWLFEYEPLLDSSNMTFDDWIRIAKDIYKSYGQYHGFVVLHGTDTLAYTASALSFMLENLGKPVVVTGAQVTVCFNNKLLRGNRTSKTDNSSLDAFHSPNMSPIAELNIDIHVDWTSVFRSPNVEKLKMHLTLNRNVGILRIFPSMTLNSVKAFLCPPMEGVVLQTYGSGNMPSDRKDILNALLEASRRGVIIVNCSQCQRGMVDVHYATGKILADIGIICGSDMTAEAALTKLAFVLGIQDMDLDQKRYMMRTNVRGEMSLPLHSNRTLRDLDILPNLAKFLRVSTGDEMKILKDALFPPLVCYAAQNDNIELIRQLKDSGANLNAPDYDQRTALHIAAGAGHLEAVKYLLSQGGCEETALLGAVHAGHIEIIELLVKAGALPSLEALALGVELCLVAANNDVHQMRAWRAANFDINTPDYDGRSALHVASGKGYTKMVELLLSYGADKTKIDDFGKTPIEEAKMNGHNRVVELLQIEFN